MKKKKGKKEGGSLRIALMMRVKGDEDILDECLTKAKKSGVDEIYVCEDFANNKVLEILDKHDAVCIKSPTRQHHEGQDINIALSLAKNSKCDWILWLDSDEILEDTTDLKKLIRENIEYSMFRFKIFPFVDSRTHYRIDGPWKQFSKGRTLQTRLFENQPQIEFGYNRVHHGGLKVSPMGKWMEAPYRIKHFTIRTREQAERKIKYYRGIDSTKNYNHLSPDYKDKELEKWLE